MRARIFGNENRAEWSFDLFSELHTSRLCAYIASSLLFPPSRSLSLSLSLSLPSLSLSLSLSLFLSLSLARSSFQQEVHISSRFASLEKVQRSVKQSSQLFRRRFKCLTYRFVVDVPRQLRGWLRRRRRAVHANDIAHLILGTTTGYLRSFVR